MVLGPITTAIHYWRKALRVAFQAWRTHSRNSDTNHWTPTSRPVAVRQNPLNIVESMRLENHAGCLLSKWLSDLQMLLFPRGPLVEFLGHLHSPACIFCQNSTVWGAQLLFARFEPTPKQTAQTSASHPQIGFFFAGVSHDSHQRIPCLSTSSPAHRCCHRPHHQLSRLSRLWRLWRSLHPRHRPWV